MQKKEVRLPTHLPVWEFALASVLTLGMFTTYWLYCVLKYVSITEGRKMRIWLWMFGILVVPVVNIIACYRLFHRVIGLRYRDNENVKISVRVQALLLVLLLFLLPVFFSGLLGWFLLLLPFCILQYHINHSPSIDDESWKWSKVQIVSCALFVLFLSPGVYVVSVSVVRTFVAAPFLVQGNAMSPTLHDEDYVIVSKMYYHNNDPERGDLVLLLSSNVAKFQIKRIVGLPNETIIIRNGYVYLLQDDVSVRLEEDYLAEEVMGRTYANPTRRSLSDETGRFVIPEEHYFVLGDNREGSLDSRSFLNRNGESAPYVPRSSIQGKVIKNFGNIVERLDHYLR